MRLVWLRVSAFVAFSSPRLGLLAALAVVASGQTANIPEGELRQPPSAARLAAIQSAAERDGWAPQRSTLRKAAIRAYQLDQIPAAEAWYHVYRWAALFGEAQAEFVPPWIQAVQSAQVAHPNMPHQIPMTSQPLGAGLSRELQGWLLGNAAVSDEFFSLLTPLDYVPNVFQILNDLHRRDAARFKTYVNLALALALVYDVPPPPNWPHGQVTTEALPRNFPAPAEAFAWWVRQDQLGRTYHRLARLGADELKFVVDTTAPLNELEWSTQLSDYPLNQLARAYTMVRYRTDRAANDRPIWPGKTYRLPDILRDGGICCDQAYFATQVGKARGVPTLLFQGAGNEGRHAWFGFLDGNRKWQLDAGRYAEQRFVTGLARDPQTWRELSDHELQFLSERFRELPAFRQSRVHAEFAAEFFANGETAPAAAAARKAVSFERRNQPAWDILIAAAQKAGRDAKAVEALMREAALAFQKSPDLEAAYVDRVAASLRARGETSAAEAEVRNIARKNQGDRTDLSVKQAREILLRSFTAQPLPEQIRTYNSLVDSFGRGAGIAFFDQVVTVFVEHLLQLQQPVEALHAVERARQKLKVEPNSQLDQEFAAMVKNLRTIR